MWLIIKQNQLKKKQMLLFTKVFSLQKPIIFKKTYLTATYMCLKNYSKNYLTIKKSFAFLIFNQMTKNIKINTGTFIKSIFKSTGTFLITLNLMQKYLRRSVKGSRLFINMFLKPILKTQNKSIFILKIKGLRKRIWINDILKKLKFQNNIVLLWAGQKIFSNLKLKKSIKKRIKKKIILKENYIW